MKLILKSLCLFSVIAILASCKKDEGKLPEIDFKTGGNYISANATVAADSTILIGINASKSEEEDVLKKFNISKSVNGAAATTVYNVDLTGAQGDAYEYDYTEALGNTSGETDKYTFTVTNRDGLTNQVELTVTIQ